MQDQIIHLVQWNLVTKNVNAERKKFCKIKELREKDNFDYDSSDKSFLSHRQEQCAHKTEAEGKMKLNKNIIMNFPKWIMEPVKNKKRKEKVLSSRMLDLWKIDEKIDGYISQHFMYKKHI